MKYSIGSVEQIRLNSLQIKEIQNPKYEFNFLWKFKTSGAIFSTPFYWDKKILVNSSDGFLYCLDTSNGQEIWKKNLIKDNRDLIINTPPVVSSDGSVYVSSLKALYVLDINNGEVKKELEGFFNPSPVEIVHNQFFVSQCDSLCSYDKIAFQKIWEFKASGYIEGPITVKDNVSFFGSETGKVCAVDINNGNLIWEFQTQGSVIVKPLLYSGVLFFGSKDKHFYALDAKSGSKKWSFEVDEEICSSPVSSGDLVCVISSLGTIYTFNIYTGKLVWLSDVSGTVYSSPVIDNDVIYLGASGRGKTFFVISLETGQALWNYNTRGEIFSSVALGEDKIYLPSADSYLYCIQKRLLTKKRPIKTIESKESEPDVKSPDIFPGIEVKVCENMIKQVEKDKEDIKSDENIKEHICNADTNNIIQSVTVPKQISETDFDKAEKLFNVGKIQLDKKIIDPAIASFKRALDLYPTNPDYLVGLGDALKAKGDMKSAFECYKKAFALAPEREDLYEIYNSCGKLLG